MLGEQRVEDVRMISRFNEERQHECVIALREIA